MKVKNTFIKDVLVYGQLLTQKWLYWSSEIENSGDVFYLIRRVSTNSAFCLDGNTITVDPAETEIVGFFRFDGTRL